MNPNPPAVQQAIETAIGHYHAGQHDQVFAICRNIIAQYPICPDAMHLAGVSAHHMGQQDVALDLIERALAFNPKEPSYYSNLGEVYRLKKLNTLAMNCYRQALAMNPAFAEAWSNLAIVLSLEGRHEEAIEACDKALAINPQLARAWNNAGNVHSELRNIDKAEECYRKALELAPAMPEAFRNMGNTMIARLKLPEAADWYRKTIELPGCSADDHWNCSLLMLMTRDFKNGWEQYEWRWQSDNFPSPIRNFPAPMWTGQDLAGKTLLMHAEQGYGDAIHFVRFAPMLADRGATIIIDCLPEQVRLFKRVRGVKDAFERGAALPPFDYHVPFFSIPRAIGLDLTNIPVDVPYLSADPADIEKFRQKIKPGFRVGLVWAGRPTHRLDKKRSIKLTALKPLLDVPGVSFVSLQLGDPVKQIAANNLDIYDASGDLNDFADTAALISTLDLLISVDTSVVHLAGALNIPAWVFIPKLPDWRWMLDRTDTPWYPTLRLFRQAVENEWETEIQIMGRELAALVQRPAE